MKLVHHFRFFGVPQAWGRPRFNSKTGAVFHKSSDWRKALVQLAGFSKPKPRIDFPIRVDVKFFFPRPKTRKNDVWMGVNPDIDNLQKELFDTLTDARWWKSDACIASVRIDQLYETESEKPGADIYVWSLNAS